VAADRLARSGGPCNRGRQPVENLDATAAAIQHHSDVMGPVSGYPPGYVKGYDEGRPRH